MAQPFLGEIEAFAFNFAPRGWALCAGQVLPINQNTALFSLLGTTYGGNGTTTFQLPDLRGRVANAFGQGQGLGNYSLGQTGGQESHTLILNEMSSGGHSHAITAKNNGTTGGTNYKSPNDLNPIVFGTQGDGSPDASESVTVRTETKNWDSAYYLSYYAKFLKDHLIVMTGDPFDLEAVARLQELVA